MDRLFLRGRVVALTYCEAMRLVRARVEDMGYQLAPGARVVPSPVQPWRETFWWDYNVEILGVGQEND
jgi:hypothetical protein